VRVDNLGFCTQCGKPIGRVDISFFHLRGILRPKWKPPKWCSGCRIDNMEEVREAKKRWYGDSFRAKW
jgi:hypothetical protein